MKYLDSMLWQSLYTHCENHTGACSQSRQPLHLLPEDEKNLPSMRKDQSIIHV